jgi:hypothetical protein
MGVFDGQPATTSGLQGLVVLGSDGSNLHHIHTASDGTVRTDPTGTTAQPVTDNGGSLTVDGTVNVGNFPSVQPINDNGGSLTVDGSVSVSNFPAVQPVSDNNGSLTVDDGAGSLTTDTPQLPGTLVGGRLDTNTGSWLGSTAPTVGQKTMADSIPVVIPNDQTLAVSSAPASSTPGFTQGNITTASIATFAVRRTAYTEQTSNAQRSIVSASANDTFAGTGARTVKITYLTSAGVLNTETVTLNGTTPVNTVAANICYIEKMEILTAGSGGVAAGVISLKAATAGGGATIGTIAAGETQTYWAHHYVPAGRTCNITSQWGGHTGTTVGSGATFTIRALAQGIANAIERQVSDSFRLYGQSSSVQRNYGSPIRVAGPARLVTYVLPETSTSTNYRASFDYYEQ